jgi:hypothetical protein
MAGHEIMLGYAYLESTLGGDGTLATLAPGGINRAMAQPNTVAPYIIIAFHSGTDSVTMNAYRVLTNLVFQVKVVGPANNTAQLTAASARIDVLLGSPPGIPPGALPIIIGGVTEGYLYSCFRESPLEVDELVVGELWTNIGGLYRMELGQVY